MKLRIGSRRSRLALAQTETVAKKIKEKEPTLEVEIIPILTFGDKEHAASLQAIGGKGVFVKEIEEALLKKEIDLAIHSLKDIPAVIPPGLRLGPSPQREDPRDVLISRFGEHLHELPRHSTIGTGSPRRMAQILYRHRKRGYKLEPIRGNVDTRINKLKEGTYDAIVLAYAGVKRLGLEAEVTQVFEPSEMMPAPCQGCLGLEFREDDATTALLIESIKDSSADGIARAERAFLAALGGNCLLPVGVYSAIDGETLTMQTILLDTKGEACVASLQSGSTSDPELVGAQLAERLLFDGGSEIIFKSVPAGM